MNIVVFTQGISPIVEPIYVEYGVQAVVESASRGCTLSDGKSALKAWCEKHGIAYFWLSKMTQTGLCWFLKPFKLELGCVYSMSQLLPISILEMFPAGVVNCHPSRLPEYRGPNPYFWTYYEDRHETALTIHYLDKGEDTGDVILQKPLQVDGLGERVRETLAPTLLKALRLIETGKVVRIKQPQTSPTMRAKNLTHDNVREVLDGLHLPLDRAAVFFDRTLDMLPLKQFGFVRQSGDWKVVGIVRQMNAEFESDRICLTRNGFVIFRPDGLIVLRPRIGLLKFIFKLIRDWMLL